MNKKLNVLWALPLAVGCSGGEEVPSPEKETPNQVIEQSVQDIDKTSSETIVQAFNQSKTNSINEVIDEYLSEIGTEALESTQKVEMTGKLFGPYSGEGSLTLETEGYSLVSGMEGSGSFDLDGSFSAMGGFASGAMALKNAEYLVKENNVFLNFEEMSLSAPLMGIPDILISEEDTPWYLIPLAEDQEVAEALNSLNEFDLGTFAEELKTAIASIELVKANGEIVEKDGEKWVPVIIDSESIAVAYESLGLVFVNSGLFPLEEKEALIADLKDVSKEIASSKVSIEGDLMFSDKNYPAVFEFNGEIKVEGFNIGTSLDIKKTEKETIITSGNEDADGYFVLEYTKDKSFDVTLKDGAESFLVEMDLSGDNINGKIWAERDEKITPAVQVNLTGDAKNLKGQVVTFLGASVGVADQEWVDFEDITKALAEFSSNDTPDMAALENLFVIDINEFKVEGVVGASKMDIDFAGAMEGSGGIASIISTSNSSQAKIKELETPEETKSIEELGALIEESFYGGAQDSAFEEALMEEMMMEELENSNQ